jgi:hypothetical protein
VFANKTIARLRERERERERERWRERESEMERERETDGSITKGSLKKVKTLCQIVETERVSRRDQIRKYSYKLVGLKEKEMFG